MVRPSELLTVVVVLVVVRDVVQLALVLVVVQPVVVGSVVADPVVPLLLELLVVRPEILHEARLVPLDPICSSSGPTLTCPTTMYWSKSHGTTRNSASIGSGSLRMERIMTIVPCVMLTTASFENLSFPSHSPTSH